MKSKLLCTLIILNVFFGITSNVFACIYPPVPFFDSVESVSTEYSAYMDSNGDYYVAVGQAVEFTFGVSDQDNYDSISYTLDYDDQTSNGSGTFSWGGLGVYLPESKTHEYAKVGTYLVTLTADDSKYQSTESIVVHVGPSRVSVEDVNENIIWYSHIQHAIEEADSGAEITIKKGTYEENINFKGKDITVTSSDPDDPDVVADTVILGDGISPVVSFNGDEGKTQDQSCNLIGLTITSDPNYGLEAHWKLNGNTEDALDLYDGTLVPSSGDSAWPDGADGQAFDLGDTNSQYISTSSMVIDPNAGLFSVFAWVNGDAASQTILSQETGSVWLCLDANKDLECALSPSGESSLVATGSNVGDGKWHFVGLVWDGYKRHLYVDGVEKAVDSSAISNFSSCTGDMHIGANTTGDDLWGGQIDDVRIYGRQVLNLRFPFGGDLLTKKVTALGNGRETISDYSSLMSFAGNSAKWDKYVELTDSFSLSGLSNQTTALIAPGTGTAFTGFFEGNGHQISDLTISGSDYLGLFGRINGGIVQNLGVVDCGITIANSYCSYAGGLAGYINFNAVINNCHVTGDLDAASGTDCLGGLVGYSSGDIINCQADVSVSGYETVGGLVGYSDGDIINCQVVDSDVQGSYITGGIVGDCWGDVINCRAENSYVDAGAYTGGIAGAGYGDLIDTDYIGGTYGYVEGDYNTGGLAGEICGIYNCSAYIANGYIYDPTGPVGGLVGLQLAGISNSYSDCDVYGVYQVGGLAGNSYNSSSISNCFAYGTVDGTSNVGGLVGYKNSQIFFSHHSFYNDLITPTGIGNDSDPAYISSISNAAFANKSTFVNQDWDFQSVWTMSDKYPIHCRSASGICGHGTEAAISKCVITGNTAEYGGGINDCDGLITDCVIKNNMAAYGAGLYDYHSPRPLDSTAHWSFENALWSLDDPCSVYDDDYLNYLEAAGDNWQVTGGLLGQCIRFKSLDSYFEGDPVIDREDAFSVFIWVRTDIADPNSFGLISQEQTETAAGYDWLELTDTGQMSTSLFGAWSADDPNYSGDPNLVVDLNVNVDFDQWHQYGLVWDGSKRYLYFDGQLVAGDTDYTATDISNLAAATPSAGKLRIGAKTNAAASDLYDRYFDELDFFDQALSDDDILKLYNYYLLSGSPKINRCKFINNGSQTQTVSGGAIKAEYSSLSVINSLFYGNNACYSGAISISDGWLDVVNSTIADDNSVNPVGGGIYSCNTKSYLLNSILWGNEADEVELDVDSQVYFDVDSIKLVRFCCVQDDSPGGTVPFSSDWQNDANNIDSDPLFVDASAGNYHLFYNSDPNVTSSPAINSGSNPLLISYGADAFYADLDYSVRIQNRVVDMGAYENGGRIAGVPVDIVLMCWIDESKAPSASNYWGNESKYLADLQTYQDQLAEAGGLVVRSGVYVPKSYFDEIVPGSYTVPDDLPWDTIDDFGLYNSATISPFTQTNIVNEAMDDYIALRDGIPRFLVLAVDDSSTGDFEDAIIAFRDYIVNNQLAENVIVFDDDIQGADWSSEDWLNELKLMLEYAVDHY